MEAIILWQYASNLFSSKCSVKEKIAALSVIYFILFIFSLFEYKWLNAVLFLLANSIFLSTQYKIKWYSALFHSAVITAFMAMCELMVYGIILGFRPNFFSNVLYFHELAILTILSKIMYFTIIYVLICVMKGKQKYNLQQDKSMILLGFIPITSIFVMLTFVSIGEVVVIRRPLDGMLTLSAFFLMGINIIVFGINQYNQKKSQEFTEMQLLLQKESDFVEYYKMLLSQNENQSILIHDIKKHLQSIVLLNDKKEHDKINAYIRQLMLSSNLKETARICEHEMLNAILCRYKRQCTNRHIAFHTDIRSGTTDFISDNDLTALFCNLLDNALEAADGFPDAYLEINISKREEISFVVITVINSCRKNPFSENNSELTTHKPDKSKHGFGLKSIRKMVSKYDGNIQMYYNGDTLTFHTIITLKH